VVVLLIILVVSCSQLDDRCSHVHTGNIMYIPSQSDDIIDMVVLLVVQRLFYVNNMILKNVFMSY
jgi:hypothetical protein